MDKNIYTSISPELDIAQVRLPEFIFPVECAFLSELSIRELLRQPGLVGANFVLKMSLRKYVTNLIR